MPPNTRSMAITDLKKDAGLCAHSTGILDSISLIKAPTKDPAPREIRKDHRFTCCRCKCSQIIFGRSNVAANKPGQAVLTYSEQKSEGLVPGPLQRWSCGGECYERDDTHVACNECQFAVRYRVLGKQGGVWLSVDRMEMMS